MTITLTREEAQQVLDALDYDAEAGNDDGVWKDIRDVLRAKLAQPEPEPVALEWDDVFDAAASAYCRSEASRKALRLCFQTRQQTTQVSIGWTANELMAFAKTVAYVCANEPQREWIGLTDDDLLEIGKKHYGRTLDGMLAVEAKLKEKNT